MKKVGFVFVVAGVFFGFTLNSVGFVLDSGAGATLGQTLGADAAVAVSDQILSGGVVAALDKTLGAGTAATLDQTLSSGAVTTLDQGSSAGATSPPLENSSGGGENRTGERTALLANVAPAVVTLRVVKTRRIYDRGDFIYHDQSEEMMIGTGFFIAEDGLILTSSHVVDYADEIFVKLNGREIQAELVGQDRILDIALVRVNVGTKKLKFLDLKADVEKNVGDPVLIIGNSHGLGPTVLAGIISALGRTNTDSEFRYNYIQIDAAIKPGCSGGPLLDSNGNVLGIVAFVYGRGLGDTAGIGFALPIDSRVLDVIEKLKKFGYRRTGYVGLYGFTVDSTVHSNYLKILNFPGKTGVMVSHIDRGSPAAKGGLMLNDLLVSYDNNKINDLNSLINMIMDTTIGSKVELLIFRNGKYLKLEVQIEENLQDIRESSANQIIRNNSLEILDMFVSQMSEELIKKYELYAEQSGIYVLDVKKGGWADMNGIDRGDVLLTVNQTQLKTKKDLLQFFENLRMNGQRDFIMLFRKQKNRNNVLIKSNINLLGH
ncbi:MAG: trypsin-like peptidase domain-containing protein [Rickettsiales bacterium]|jgi:serine protease Do|nr:trypsin-like peptidase domain-containing protein [Rickettsiales bacterium]